MTEEEKIVETEKTQVEEVVEETTEDTAVSEETTEGLPIGVGVLTSGTYHYEYK